MRHLSMTLIFSGLMLCGITGGTAWAQSAHFVGKVTATLQGNDVLVCFKEAGLGSSPVEVGATADVTATVVCINKSGQCPNAANKRTVSGPIEKYGHCHAQQGPDYGLRAAYGSHGSRTFVPEVKPKPYRPSPSLILLRRT